MNLIEGLRHFDKRFIQPNADLHFAMQRNGYSFENGQWTFIPGTPHILKEFKGQSVSFFGPNPDKHDRNSFFSIQNIEHSRFIDAFDQHSVINMIRKYRGIDEDQAARIMFILGGIVRHLAPQDKIEIGKAVRFAAQMTSLGERESGDAIANAIAMYIISGGSLEENKHFTEQVECMAEVIKRDPVVPLETKDLGLSQALRLRTFLDLVSSGKSRPFPDTSEYISVFDNFPTVGAEFHLSLYAPARSPNLWQRLAILNMSQYQRGSYIQLSRNDRDVIEVRMNPSFYPITIANWNHIRLLLPELNQAYFWITLNRPKVDFSWKQNHDKDLINRLHALAILCYASTFDTIPSTIDRAERDFGTRYLGQTVRMVNGEYKFTGNWGGEEGNYGQIAVYAGFGNNLPHLAYYLSMALTNPYILRSTHDRFWSHVRNLKHALTENPTIIKSVFEDIDRRIETDLELSRASQAGKQIMELLYYP